ncbi:hypothetical protein PVAP13_7KG213155 [Panicum virgatum]|uniref:Uncharacterized protein n=1 Tax=Panicum virgatum TaxID=38727 RepID=A0A8T0QNF9_PANVG|nr:hypothetical protein PVAP13_7KG213155 [Panicum virgatum]KAG2572956.1 hypothetical protein PVAP13_7KG213155 [Panicum virgatum]
MVQRRLGLAPPPLVASSGTTRCRLECALDRRQGSGWGQAGTEEAARQPPYSRRAQPSGASTEEPQRGEEAGAMAASRGGITLDLREVLHMQ